MRLARLCPFAFLTLLGWGASGCRTTAGGGRTVYLVKVEKGDTVASIAQKFDTTWSRVLRLNGLKSPADVAVGQTLRVEPGPGGIMAQDSSGSGSVSQPMTRLPSRTVRRSRSHEDDRGNVASPQEFKEEDFPELETDKPGTEGRGLLYGAPRKGRRGARVRDLRWPVIGRLSSPYGPRGRQFHAGIDIAVPKGAVVLPAASGTVTFAGEKPGYGSVVMVQHSDFMTVYAHLSQISTHVGDVVETHTVLGEVGTTGNASGPHLHFEVKRPDGRTLDPMKLLPTVRQVADSGTG